MKTATTASDRDGTIALAIRAVILIGAVATVVAAVIGGLRPSVSVAVGAGVAALNLWVVAVIVRRSITPGKRSVPWGLMAALKFSLLFGGLFVLLETGLVDLLPLALGYGALPIGIVASRFGATDSDEPPVGRHAKRGA